MNIQEYISSGILESYVMGLTTPAESAEVERLAAAHPEIKAELEEIRSAIEGYATAHEKTPPAQVKEKVMTAIAAQEKAGSGKVIDIRAAENSPARSSRFSTYAAAAAIALLLVSGIFNYIFYSRWKSTQDSLASITAEKEYIAQQFQAEQASNKMMSEQMAVMKDPQNRMVRLKGMEIAPTSMATIYWNPASKDVYLAVNNLPAAPEGMQYQLWAIVDGKPVDAGMIDMNAPGLHKMKSFENAQAFAVTLEKAGGSPTPNLAAMYVMGSV